MPSYEVTGDEFRHFRRVVRQLEAAMAQRGGIGIPAHEAIASATNLLSRLQLVLERIEPTADWNNPQDLARPVRELMNALSELEIGLNPRLGRRIVTQLGYAKIYRVADLTGHTRADLENDHAAKLGPWLIDLIEAALALRNLRLKSSSSQSGTKRS